jgi:hypothetical protein
VRAAQGQAVDLLHVEQRAAEQFRQQAGVVGRDQRALEVQRADLEQAVGDPRLGGQAELGVVILGAAGGAVGRQQPGSSAAAAGVELEAEQADGVDAEADGAFAEAGLQAQEEALRPFVGVVARAALAEVAIEVEVAQFEAGVAVLDQVGLGEQRASPARCRRAARQPGGEWDACWDFLGRRLRVPVACRGFPAG